MNDEATDLLALDLGVPPMLEAALGYDGPARWAAFWWEPCGDEARWSDGRVTAGADWYAWRTFVEHPPIQASLAAYELGSSETPATHTLLLDRDERRLFVAPIAVAAAFLAAQWTPRGELPTDELRFGSVLDLASEAAAFRPLIPAPDLAATVATRIQRAHANNQALERWLAEQLPPFDPTAPWDLIEQTLAAWACQAQEER